MQKKRRQLVLSRETLRSLVSGLVSTLQIGDVPCTATTSMDDVSCCPPCVASQESEVPPTVGADPRLPRV